MQETVLRVQDMSCGHCVATVEMALNQVAGVDSVEVYLQTKLARISQAGDVDASALLGAEEGVGFTPEEASEP